MANIVECLELFPFLLIFALEQELLTLIADTAQIVLGQSIDLSKAILCFTNCDNNINKKVANRPPSQHFVFVCYIEHKFGDILRIYARWMGSMLATALDILICGNNQNRKRDIISQQVASLKSLLVTMFQVANAMLLFATGIENAILIQLYVWYSLGYVVLGLMLTLVDFVSKFQDYGCISLIDFIADVVYFFVTFRSMLVVDMYRKHLSTQFVKV